MCGIFQVFSRNRPIERDRFVAALASMQHRGPDHTGIKFHDAPLPILDGLESVYIASGHQRLSILDLDARSHQPLERFGASLVFNGEIYNYRTLAAEMRAGGDHFDTTGDTEVLFHGLHQYGLDFLQRANGMWAFAYLDQERRMVLASRDRYGKKPAFYYLDDKCLCISSTIQAIHLYLGRKPHIRDDQVDSFLLHGALFPAAGDDTHFIDIHQIPAGHSLTFDLNAWTASDTTYFSIDQALTGPPPREADLPALIADAVDLRLVSDRKVGLLLSGGIDSTLILSAMCARGLQEQVHCFIGETGRSDDAEYAKQCAAQLGIEATVVNLGYGGDTFTRLLKMCRHQEKPFPFLGSSMAMSEMYERVAEQDVRVVLDGTGGDEFFGGYWERYFPIALREAARSGDWAWISEVLRYTPRAGALIFQALRDVALHNALIDFDPRATRKRLLGPARLLGLHRTNAKSSDPLASPPRDFITALALDVGPGGRLGEWIWHNDRNAMMASVENRSPLLDFRFAPYLGTGYRDKFHRQWNKYPLRKAFDAFIPLPTQWRQQKQGFRWNGKAFIRENRDAILGLIESSGYLAARYDVRRFIAHAHTGKHTLLSSLTPRLLCIAGIDAELGLAS
jgi:asparagine synthase (glutamine-hydrolysing)